MAKKAKRPAKRARRKTAKAPTETKVQDVPGSPASDDVKGHLLGAVAYRTRVGPRGGIRLA